MEDVHVDVPLDLAELNCVILHFLCRGGATVYTKLEQEASKRVIYVNGTVVSLWDKLGRRIVDSCI